MSRYARFTWGVLAYNVGVIAWGAYVRATGSGAGCGAHWPMCQGGIVPSTRAVETIIEYSHRVTSGLALVFMAALVAGAFRVFHKGHPARRGAAVSCGLMALEAMLGAALVLFRLVDKDASLARAVIMPIHHVNTLMLLGALALTAWWASGGPEVRLRGQGALGLILAVGVAAIIALAVSGALTALGDTLFPPSSLAEGWRQDVSPTAHVLLRLRILHPLIAVAVGVYLIAAAMLASEMRRTLAVRVLAAGVIGIFALQMGAGVLNLVLLTPVWMQLAHLVLADLTWIAFVLLCTASLAADRAVPGSVTYRSRDRAPSHAPAS